MFYHSLALLEVMQSSKAQKNSRWILKQTDIYLKPWGFSPLFYARDTEKLCQHLSLQKLLIHSEMRSLKILRGLVGFFGWLFFLDLVFLVFFFVLLALQFIA